MKLEIVSIHNHGNAAEEYVLLRVLQNCDLVNYAIADSTYLESGQVSNRLRHFYWMPQKVVKKDELIVVRSARGNNGEYNNTSDKKVHNLYWNLGTPVWNDEKDCAVLLEISSWKFKKAR